jgi:hypothetical protein
MTVITMMHTAVGNEMNLRGLPEIREEANYIKR